ncbi:glutamine amidotransferase [Actinotalea ferrariae]|uniref:glutamine amidotransferase n=1 Tax=Actinotalea ferrariae TaxID=1386098 RepID=UPI001C8C4C25|nr:glutamine amidotransferase [Actinotalea ferrariae]MBX9244378.1 glutamine amidotransferase [Actinotalea ferrariae]
MKPFLLLSTRADDAAADGELEAIARFGGLDPEREIRRVRLEAGPLPPVDLDDWSGVVVGGSPFNASDPPEEKSAVQHRVEAELHGLLDEVVARDFPFLGACYGVGTLGVHQGGVIDRTYGEPVGSVTVTLTEAGREDPVFAHLPPTFDAFVGHKEAVRVPPPGAVVLASSPGCPVQAFRVRRNLYATQFHPELDVPGLVARVEVYRHAGYFPPEELGTVIDQVTGAVVDDPPKVLAAFVERYAR